jgi:transcription-repair coupling factor (superfamily II helicase)
MMHSYGYYSRIVDARLAHGYLTSRPGLYAAPRVLQAGQKLSQEKLLSILRRAGYVESEASDVWSGSFESRPGLIEIRPNRIGDLQPQSVSISFADDQIIELKGDQARHRILSIAAGNTF